MSNFDKRSFYNSLGLKNDFSKIYNIGLINSTDAIGIIKLATEKAVADYFFNGNKIYELYHTEKINNSFETIYRNLRINANIKSTLSNNNFLNINVNDTLSFESNSSYAFDEISSQNSNSSVVMSIGSISENNIKVEGKILKPSLLSTNSDSFYISASIYNNNDNEEFKKSPFYSNQNNNLISKTATLDLSSAIISIDNSNTEKIKIEAGSNTNSEYFTFKTDTINNCPAIYTINNQNKIILIRNTDNNISFYKLLCESNSQNSLDNGIEENDPTEFLFAVNIGNNPYIEYCEYAATNETDGIKFKYCEDTTNGNHIRVFIPVYEANNLSYGGIEERRSINGNQ